MKIIKLNDFLQLPPGTLFSKFRVGSDLDDLAFKGDSIIHPASEFAAAYGDFLYEDLVAIRSESSEDLLDKTVAIDDARGGTLDLDHECTCRDGMFDPDQLFAVFDSEEAQALAARLRKCVAANHTTIDDTDALVWEIYGDRVVEAIVELHGTPRDRAESYAARRCDLARDTLAELLRYDAVRRTVTLRSDLVPAGVEYKFDTPTITP